MCQLKHTNSRKQGLLKPEDVHKIINDKPEYRKVTR